MKAIDLEDKIEALEGQLQRLRSGLKEATSHRGDGGAPVAERLQQHLSELSQRSREIAGAVRDTTKQTVATVESKIEDHPWLSVLTAAGIGVVLGALFFRRKGHGRAR